MDRDLVAFGVTERCLSADGSFETFIYRYALRAQRRNHVIDIVDLKIDARGSAWRAARPLRGHQTKTPTAQVSFIVFLEAILNVWAGELQAKLLFVPAPRRGYVV